MLKSLYIKNYALIESLDIDFNPGFSVITGETGAGKSIILGALALILGQRADIKSIKQGEDKCIIEGIFNISAYRLKNFFDEREIDYDANCILRRELLSSGKSRSFINDTPVALNDLKDLGIQLIDIHSQHQNLLLGSNKFQMQILDILAGTQELLQEYQNLYAQYKQSEKKLNELTENFRKNKEEEDYIRFQYQTLSDANLKEGEQEEMENELETLTHAEDIKTTLFKIHTLLTDDEQGIISLLKESLNASQSLIRVFPQAEEMQQRIDTAFIDLKDLSNDVERVANDTEFNPDRMAYLTERLDTIYTLQRKYNAASLTDLIGLMRQFSEKLDKIYYSEGSIQELQEEIKKQHDLLIKKAELLSQKRKSAIKTIEKSLTEKVAPLGMPNVRFVCDITPKSIPDSTGLDNVQFLFSANKNIPLQPVAEVASGGEISRLMLCLKSLIAGVSALPTIIFDEIDTGVSGEIADKMGEIMKEFGQKMQVIAITHLPQIAAKGNTHYLVYKSEDDETTRTNLRQLSNQERLEEIARMLSGATLTDAAIQNAKIMLEGNK